MPALLSLPPSGPNKLRHLVIGPVGIRPQVLGDKYLSQGLDSGGLADVFLEHLLFAIQHHLVERVGQGLATGVRAGFIGTRLDSRLRQL
jgi:hypothetical protein